MTENDFTPVFRVLHDKTELNDAFGPHQRIADTLAELIAEPAETHLKEEEHAGCFVALEGGWGSGKSSIISMLREKLEKLKTPETITVIFDAWAHSGDRLRRQFLEILVDQIDKSGSMKDRPKWDKLLRETSGYLKNKIERRELILSGWGVAFGISLLLVPVGGVIASNLLTNFHWTWSLDDFFPTVAISLALCALPLFIILIAVTSKIIKGKPIGSVFSLLVNQFGNETNIEISTDPDPTSIEFQRTFTKLMAETLNNRNRRVILVIDNLDRLSASQALRLWEALQTFIDKNAHEQEPWQGKLWVIVTYDRKELDGHFKEVRIQTDLEQSLMFSKPQRDGLGHFDKVFDLRINVPLPLLSKWQPYFRKLLKKAFPSEGEDAIEQTMRLMSVYRNLERTPRALKRIINLAGPVYLQWRKVFELPLILHYALRTSDGFDLDELHSRHIGKNDSLDLQIVLGPKYSEKIVAIHHNMPVELALQFQKIEIIADSLRSNTPEMLKEVQTSTPDFDTLLEWTITNRVYFAGMQELVLTASVIERSGVIEHCGLMAKEAIRDKFREYFAIFYDMIRKPISERKNQNDDDRLEEFLKDSCNLQHKIHNFLPDTLKLCDDYITSINLFYLLTEILKIKDYIAQTHETTWLNSLQIVVEAIKKEADSSFLQTMSKDVMSLDVPLITSPTFAGLKPEAKPFTEGGYVLLKRIGLPVPTEDKK